MKKSTIVLLSVLAVILILIFIFIGSYNGLVKKSETVDGKLSDVSVQLERRADLIPNLVNTVKGYAAHEEKVFADVSEAREKLLGAESVSDKSAANDELSSAVGRLLAVAEAYPELKANTNFIQLQDELAGTENRISTARRDYNAAVKEYNTEIKVFPKNILAGMFGFTAKDYFEAKESSNEAPKVEF